MNDIYGFDDWLWQWLECLRVQACGFFLALLVALFLIIRGRQCLIGQCLNLP